MLLSLVIKNIVYGRDKFLICHVTSREHIFKGLYKFIAGRFLMVSHHLAMFGGHWSSASGDIKYLKYHVTLQNHVIEGLSNVMSGNSSWYITTLPILVAIDIVVEIRFHFFMWSSKTTQFKGQVAVTGNPQGKSLSYRVWWPYALWYWRYNALVRVVSRIWIQLLFFENALFYVSGDNLDLKRPANSWASSKLVAFVAGVQKKPKRCRATLK